MTPGQSIQCLDRVIADADVDEILFDELADAGDVRIVVLLVEASGPLWQTKQPAPPAPPAAGVKNNLAPRS